MPVQNAMWRGCMMRLLPSTRLSATDQCFFAANVASSASPSAPFRLRSLREPCNPLSSNTRMGASVNLVKLVSLILCLGIALPSAAAANFLDDLVDSVTAPDLIILKKRTQARWQALELTRRSLNEAPVPAGWDAGVFVSTKLLGEVVGQLRGLRLENTSPGLLSGARVDVVDIRVQSSVGSAHAELKLRAAKGDLSIDLHVAAAAAFQRVDRPGGDKDAVAYFRIEPLTIEPTVELGWFNFGLRGFWARLVPELASLLADPKVFEVGVPLRDSFSLTFGVKETRTEPVNDRGATITYEASMPESVVEQRISYSAPVFTKDGFWIFGRLNEKGQAVLKPAEPQNLTDEQLRLESAQMEREISAKLAALPEGRADLQVYLGQEVFRALARKIAQLPADHLRLTIVTRAATGFLAGRERRHAVLLDVAANAELADATKGRATVQLQPPAVSWNDGKLVVVLEAGLDAYAPIKVHIDPPIGGGIGTSVGIVGNGQGRIVVAATPAIMSSKGLQMAVLDARMGCELVRADLRTDGVFKTDFGWTKVPSIGGRLDIPIGREAATPRLLFAKRPQFVRLPITDLSTKAPWVVRPSVLGAIVNIEPKTALGDAAGYFFAANVVVTPAPAPEQGAAWKTSADDVERRTEATAKQNESAAKEALEGIKYESKCDLKPKFALLLGDLEFGENNEIVKFLVALGKLPQQALEELKRLGHEVSTEKVKAWLDDPKGSFERGEAGRQLKKLEHETSPEKVKGWVEKPGESLKRGDLNPGNWKSPF